MKSKFFDFSLHNLLVVCHRNLFILQHLRGLLISAQLLFNKLLESLVVVFIFDDVVSHFPATIQKSLSLGFFF